MRAVLKYVTEKTCACRDAACFRATGDEAQSLLAGLIYHLDESTRKAFMADTEKSFATQLKALEKCTDRGAKFSPEVMKMTSFADAMCACRHPTCGRREHKRMIRWVKSHFHGKKKSAPASQVKLWKAAQQRLNKCYLAAMKSRAK